MTADIRRDDDLADDDTGLPAVLAFLCLLGAACVLAWLAGAALVDRLLSGGPR